MTDNGRPVEYEIHVEGSLDGRWAAWFNGLHVSGQSNETVICGLIADQAALHGVLNQIRDLGLGLISIRRLATDDAEPAHHDHELGPERAPDPDPPVESHVEGLRAAERQLQAAQLSSDVAVLSRLLDDSLLFTGPDGRLYTKDDDLRAHAEGVQSLTKLEEEDLRLTVAGQLGVTWFLGTVEATVDGQPLQARMRYTRIWRRDDTASWRVIAAHASIVPAL